MLGANRLELSMDGVGGDVVSLEHPGEKLDRGLVLFHHHFARPEPHEIVDGANVAGAHHVLDSGVEIVRRRDPAPLVGGRGNHEYHHPSFREPNPLEDLAPGPVPEEDGDSGRPGVAHDPPVLLEDDVRDPRGREHPLEVATAQAVADDDRVIGEPFDPGRFLRRGHEDPRQPEGGGDLLRERAGGGDEGRRREHRETRRRQEELVMVRGEEAERSAHAREDEGELTDLGETHAGDETRDEAMTESQHRRRRHQRLEHRHGDRRRRHQEGVVGDVADVEKHSDRGEEDSGEGIAEWKDVREGLKSVLGLGDDQAGEKSAEGEREAEARGEKRRSQTQEEDADGEELAVLEEHQAVENPGNDEPPAHDQRGDHQNSGHEVSYGAVYVSDGGAGEYGHEQHERHDAKVLEKKKRHGDAAVGGVDLAPVHIGLEDDRRRRESHEGSVENPLPHLETEGGRDPGDGGESEKDLEAASLNELPPEGEKPGERKLEADGEEEQHDAELGDLGHRVGASDEAESMRPGRDPCKEKAGDGRDAEAMRECDDGEGDADQDYEVPENSDVVHRVSFRATIIEGRCITTRKQRLLKASSIRCAA